MSKQRQVARAQREAAAAERAAAAQAQRDRAAAARAKREARALRWRRFRVWQHGATFRRRRETYGAVATLVLLAMLVAYLVTRSLAVVLGTALVGLVAAPVLLVLAFDRRR